MGGRTVVLTPHPGEMARLAGMTVAEVQAQSAGGGAGVCAALGRDFGAEGGANADCASRMDAWR
jgi:hypothetical protein